MCIRLMHLMWILHAQRKIQKSSLYNRIQMFNSVWTESGLKLAWKKKFQSESSHKGWGILE